MKNTEHVCFQNPCPKYLQFRVTWWPSPQKHSESDGEAARCKCSLSWKMLNIHTLNGQCDYETLNIACLCIFNFTLYFIFLKIICLPQKVHSRFWQVAQWWAAQSHTSNSLESVRWFAEFYYPELFCLT